MTAKTQSVLSDAGTAAVTFNSNRPVRVAVVCDYLEEQWPSMNLVADMLCAHLRSVCGPGFAVEQVRPELRARISRLPLVSQKQTRNADRLINRFVDYSRFLGRIQNDYDLFHIVDHSYAQLVHVLPPGRTIVTCHDLDTFLCLLRPEREKRPYWFRAMSRHILRGLQQARHVVTVSSATRDDLLHYGLLPPEKISVIPNGVHPAYTRILDANAGAEAARLLTRANNGPRLLSVGSTLPRKRLDVLLRVFAQVRERVPGACLVRVGDLTPEQFQLAKELAIGESLIAIPFVEPDVLAAIYQRCDLLLHTSEAEGFGLPLIESMASGCPVVASDIAILREVAGDAAAFCRIADVDAWTETVVRLLEEKVQNAPAWERRRQQSMSHARRYSWIENARQTADIYRSVLERE